MPTGRVTALIAEDEPLLRKQLKARLAQAWPELVVVAEAENGAEAVALASEFKPDVAFLDIRMPVKDGIAVAEAIGDQSHIVFVTAYDEYAVTAFEQGAVDYLLKPVTVERIAKVVLRLQARVASPPLDLAGVLRQLAARDSGGPLRWIKASLGNSMRLISVDEVCYFHAEDKYTKVVTTSGEALIRKTIRELFDVLDPEVFWQVHRGTIVNIHAIASVSSDESGRREITLSHRPEKLEVRRSFAHLFKSS
jgi:DNA-binding LytR/AlgR family response regulator